MKVAVIFPENQGLNFKVTDKHINQVKNACPEAEVVYSQWGTDLIEKEYKADVIIAWGDPKFLDIHYCLWDDHLKWIHALSAGVEHLLDSEVQNIRGLHITNSRGIHGIPISEHVLGFLLGYYRQLFTIKEHQKVCAWERKLKMQELCGRTACIVGTGAIGREIARKLKAFDVTVLGVKRTDTVLPDFDRVYLTPDMNEALKQSDIVIAALPYTTQTDKLFDSKRFAEMKQNTVFVNVGRGRTVDTDALILALEDGTLAAAMVDTVEPEPLPKEHPLWGMEQVLISPHIAADSNMYFERAFWRFAEFAEYYLTGKPFPEEISLSEQY